MGKSIEPASSLLQIQDCILRSNKDSKILHKAITVIFLVASASALFFHTLRPRIQDLPFFSWQFDIRGYTRPEVVSCDFSASRTSLCYLEGDVRISRGSNFTVSLATSNKSLEEEHLIAQIHPYTRKFSASVMETIEQVSIIKTPSKRAMNCNATHSVPAVVFSAGGYTGNTFHAYTDGLVPLFITSAKYHGQVVFVVLQYQTWWAHKYSQILKQLSHYPIVDYDKLDQVHCFSEVVVGLNFHGELAIDPAAMPQGNTMADFQQMVHNALGSEKEDLAPSGSGQQAKKPRLVLIARNRSRVIVNQDEVVKLAEQIGFEVQTLEPAFNTKLSVVYSVIHSADVFVGVHGAGLTQFLFLRPNTTFIQIVPYALDGVAYSCFGQPAEKAGFHYIGYTIPPSESTLLDDLGANHTVIVNPEAIKAKGWDEMGKYYLDMQNIKLSLPRFELVLREAFQYSASSQSKFL